MQMTEDKDMKCVSNHEYKFDVGNSLGERNLGARKNDDVEVDVVSDHEGALDHTQSEDVTGSSSSFGGTHSEDGNGEYESEGEVGSELHVNAPPMQGVGGPGDMLPMRKKKVSSHWRAFIQPLMWRCKWAELQIKKFQSQAMKYDRELEKAKQAKQLRLENFESQGLCAKSMPFSYDSQREKAKKRKLRQRQEDLNVDAYMADHNLFSCFAARRAATGVATVGYGQTNLVVSADKNAKDEFTSSDELSSLKFSDDHLLEQILWKIDVAHSQVSEMKLRLDTVMTENNEIFSSVDKLSQLLPDIASSGPVTESASTSSRNGPPSLGVAFASKLMEYNTGDVVKLESADSNREEGSRMKGVIEHADDEPTVVASRKRSTEGILIYNRRAKKARTTDSGGIKIHPIENLNAPKEEKSKNTEPVSASEDSWNKLEPLAPKLRSLAKLIAPNIKRKRATRARRKAISSLWSRRLSG